MQLDWVRTSAPPTPPKLHQSGFSAVLCTPLNTKARCCACCWFSWLDLSPSIMLLGLEQPQAGGRAHLMSLSPCSRPPSVRRVLVMPRDSTKLSEHTALPWQHQHGTLMQPQLPGPDNATHSLQLKYLFRPNYHQRLIFQ